jgi:hypothetical protein
MGAGMMQLRRLVMEAIRGSKVQRRLTRHARGAASWRAPRMGQPSGEQRRSVHRRGIQAPDHELPACHGGEAFWPGEVMPSRHCTGGLSHINATQPMLVAR